MGSLVDMLDKRYGRFARWHPRSSCTLDSAGLPDDRVRCSGLTLTRMGAQGYYCSSSERLWRDGGYLQERTAFFTS